MTGQVFNQNVFYDPVFPAVGHGAAQLFKGERSLPFRAAACQPADGLPHQRLTCLRMQILLRGKLGGTAEHLFRFIVRKRSHTGALRIVKLGVCSRTACSSYFSAAGGEGIRRDFINFSGDDPRLIIELTPERGLGRLVVSNGPSDHFVRYGAPASYEYPLPLKSDGCRNVFCFMRERKIFKDGTNCVSAVRCHVRSLPRKVMLYNHIIFFAEDKVKMICSGRKSDANKD